jgi:hypothetical protein
MGTFNAQNLANTAWAFATAGVRAPGLFAALAVHAEQRMGTFSAQALANTAWAFAAMHLLDAPATPASTVGTVGTPALHPWLGLVISMAELYLENAQADDSGQQIKCVSALELAPLIYHSAQGSTPDPLLGRLRAAARARSLALNEGEAAVTSSASQLELSARLRAAGWEHEDDACLEGGLLVVDMACSATRVVVEFDGPSHYLSHVQSGKESYNGSTLLKTKLLEALGWRDHPTTGSAGGHGRATATRRLQGSPPRSCLRQGSTEAQFY